MTLIGSINWILGILLSAAYIDARVCLLPHLIVYNIWSDDLLENALAIALFKSRSRQLNQFPSAAGPKLLAKFTSAINKLRYNIDVTM